MDKKDGSAGEVQEKSPDICKDETEHLSLQDCNGIRRTLTNPFYMTTYDDYGYFSPTVHTTSKRYHGKQQRFGQEQFVRGMYRDHSLNM